MLIDGKLHTYKVVWRKVHYIKAVAVVYERASLLGFKYWKKVWIGGGLRDEDCARRMKPNELRDWFSRAVFCYEEYKEAWDEYLRHG